MRILATFLLLSAGAFAQLRTGGTYSAVLEAHSAGGGESSSSSYSSQITLAAVAGIGESASTAVVNRGGFAGQIMNPTSLAIAASPTTVDEGGTRALTANVVMDDNTTLALAGTAPAWSVSSGPLVSISPAGVVTAGLVYADTGAEIYATWQSLGSSLALTVLNVDPDNFGLYAGDKVPDDWQVTYFGVGNPAALAGQDPDGDGQDNRFEYLAGIDPNNPISRFRLQILPVLSEPLHKDLRFDPVWPDRTYVVEQSISMQPGTWLPVTGVTSTVSGVRTVTDTNAVGDLRFYRVVISKP